MNKKCGNCRLWNAQGTDYLSKPTGFCKKSGPGEKPFPYTSEHFVCESHQAIAPAMCRDLMKLQRLAGATKPAFYCLSANFQFGDEGWWETFKAAYLAVFPEER